MANLLQETISMLESVDKTPANILWCGSKEFGYFSWELFEKLADKIYDNGYGSPAVCDDLLIVGKDWWLERHEYGGSEWWEYKGTPEKPKNQREPIVIVDDGLMWSSLVENNKLGGKYGETHHDHTE